MADEKTAEKTLEIFLAESKSGPVALENWLFIHQSCIIYSNGGHEDDWPQNVVSTFFVVVWQRKLFSRPSRGRKRCDCVRWSRERKRMWRKIIATWMKRNKFSKFHLIKVWMRCGLIYAQFIKLSEDHSVFDQIVTQCLRFRLPSEWVIRRGFFLRIHLEPLQLSFTTKLKKHKHFN